MAQAFAPSLVEIEGEAIERLAAPLKLVRGGDQGGEPGALQPLPTLAQLPEQVALVGHHDLGGRRGGPGLPVRDQVGERAVGGVAQGGDHRDSHRLDGAHHRLLVEGHQLLEAAATTGDDDDVGHLVLVALPQGSHQATLRGRSLHTRRVEDQPAVRKPLPDRLL